MSNSKLKIGITCYPSTGGSGIIATELGHELAERGHEVHFISYGIPFRLDLSSPNIFFHEVQVNDYELFKYPDYSLPLAVKMANVSQHHQLDVLHVHYAVPHATAAYLAKQMIGCEKSKPAVITTLHGTDITLMSKDANYRPIIQYSIEHSCGVTAVSQSLIDDTYKTFDLQKDIQLIHNFYKPKPATIDRKEIRDQFGIKDEVLFIHLSNLRPVKRVPDILKAFAQGGKKHNAKLLILAGGQFTQFNELVKKLDITQNVIVKEQVLDVENYIQASDAGIYASKNESFGLGILETMFYGKPVIATNAGGVPEVIDHEQNGFLFDVGNIYQMSDYIEKLSTDRDTRELFGRSAKKKAESHFSTEKIIDQYIHFYQKITHGCTEYSQYNLSP